MWCLGNEMDGPWQLGHSTAYEYGQIAAQTASAMRQIDPDLELVVCGSSGAQMPTFGEWERVVLEATYDNVDYISCHAYYEPQGDDYGSFLASAVNMDRFIEEVAATADHVKALKRSDKTMYISFDEWNVWYMTRYNEVDKITDIADWPVAPRLLEDSYSVMDAVVFGSLLISLIRHADRVTAASLAQLVNVIAPIMTEPGGPSWRQTTFFPFSITSRLARGVALEFTLESPTYETKQYGAAPLVDAVATHDPETGDMAVFVVNRSMTEEAAFDIDTSVLGDVEIVSAVSVHDDDIHAANTLADRERVAPRENTSVRLGDASVGITLPPVSWTSISLRARSSIDGVVGGAKS
jgi:alpha-N-arabinofuranosidase